MMALYWLQYVTRESYWYQGDISIDAPVERLNSVNTAIVNPVVFHYDDVTMSAMASQITSLTIVYSTVYSGPDQRKHQSSPSLAFVRGIHRGPVNSPHIYMASNSENVSIWWRHHVHVVLTDNIPGKTACNKTQSSVIFKSKIWLEILTVFLKFAVDPR